MLIFFAKGYLPWQGLHVQPGQTKADAILKVKEETTMEELTQGLPSAFLEYMTYCRKLEFSELPDYQKLRDMFKDLLTSREFVNDEYFDWLVKKQGHYIAHSDYYDFKGKEL